MKIRVGITIDSPTDHVWRVIEPIEYHVEWMADAESIRFTTPQETGVGTKFECRTRVGPFRMTDKMVVTEWTPGSVMGIAHRGIVAGRGRFTLKRRPRGRTRFTWSEQLIFPWWMGGPVGELAASPVLRSIWRRNLRRLKQLIEQGVVSD
jgi:polyketide cyclase/dehydrase/lipid transport protein